jgi:hypothetical protein
MVSPWLQLGTVFLGFGKASVKASGEALGKTLLNDP